MYTADVSAVEWAQKLADVIAAQSNGGWQFCAADAFIVGIIHAPLFTLSIKKTHMLTACLKVIYFPFRVCWVAGNP